MRLLRRTLASLAFAVPVLAAAVPVAADTDITWGTSAVGSSGHKALVNLANVLNKEFKGYQVTVQAMPGAIVSVKSYASGKTLGYYGADIAFYELANGTNRFKGFKEQMKRQPVQSFWTFTVEVGVAINARDKDTIKSWGDLTGKQFFSGPLPWDTRAHLERGLAAVGAKHNYIEVDLATAGSLMESKRLDGFIIYTNAEATTAPWITEAGLTTNWLALNPSKDEEAKLNKAGIALTEVKAEAFKRDIGMPSVKLLPFYYGFHVGMEIPEADVYRMLTIVEKNVDELVSLDKAFAQLKDMAGMQRKGVESSIDLVPVHPGLAKWMKEKGVWDAKWDGRIAKP
tara:strand:- start:14824 stop:15849 length:1026 start_codon:yes stop_codon:yes gene_type:complete